ncbi:TetR/AcrR family transcriptional regulator [Nocardia sp. NPDC057668]|uniref:TetR/AcrR family transcriptional regulator n=1 Tax=Nocardia sp. NPDC057668 TaxID=3346202 RepID=UPI00366DCB2B
MPIEVNSSDRKRQIGEAGVRIVREHGTAGLTVRAVADVLGGSTSLVTNYVRTRTQLLDLTLETLVAQWDNQIADLTGSPADKLRAVAAWALDWAGDSSPLVAKILVQLLGEQTIDADRLAALHRELDRLHARITRALEAAGIPDPAPIADLLFLASRGAMVSQVENPGGWPTERLTNAAVALTRRLDADRPPGPAPHP